MTDVRPTGVSTVVLDSTFFGRGAYRSVRVRRVAERLRARRFMVAVPEVVVWEWAERLHAHFRVADATLAQLHAGVSESGLPIDAPRLDGPDIDDVVDVIDADLRTMPAVGIVTATLADGAEAIRNQVLQVGAGSRRDGVKTGAAESLVAAAVERCAQDRVGDPVVLCTGDEVLAQHVAKLECEPHVARHERALWEWFGTTDPPDPSVADAVRTSIDTELRDWLAEPRSAGAPFPLIVEGMLGEEVLLARLGLPSNDMHRMDMTVDDIDRLDVTGVAVVDDDAVPRVVVAILTAVVRADVVISSVLDGTHLHRRHAGAHVRVDVPITVDFDEAWVFDRFDCADAAHVSLLDT